MNLLVQLEVQCPYCGEEFPLTVDTTQGDYETTEDCSVCCRPIVFTLECLPGEVCSVGVEIA